MNLYNWISIHRMAVQKGLPINIYSIMPVYLASKQWFFATHPCMVVTNMQHTTRDGSDGLFKKALEIKMEQQKNFTISGNGKQVRDVLHASDVVSLYFKASENIEKTKGKAFNIGGGIKNSLSLLELFTLLEDNLQIKMKYKQLPFRESDQLVFVANNKKAQEFF